MIVNDKEYKNPLFVFAMSAEAGNYFQDVETLFTGLGKVNAAYELMKKISENRPDIIINLGTAGGFGFKKGEVVNCTAFVQRDMDVSELGFEKYKTPFSNEEPILVYGLKMNDLPSGICGTGDSFETNHNTDVYNVVDMESYALALVCKRENIPFLCLKYISDGADDDAANDWNEEVKKAAQKLRTFF
ncbi:MAG: nucleosidase [Cruoricaptor ignavus]|nr:nucleosidase [Cruoricaptor ignavus]